MEKFEPNIFNYSYGKIPFSYPHVFIRLYIHFLYIPVHTRECICVYIHINKFLSKKFKEINLASTTFTIFILFKNMYIYTSIHTYTTKKYYSCFYVEISEYVYMHLDCIYISVFAYTGIHTFIHIL
jgi:hypothetical protein